MNSPTSFGTHIAVTTNEPQARKHLVEPYEEQPVVRAGVKVQCAWCGNPGFRRSRLRLEDVVHLLAVKYPVRCTRCSHRQYISLPAARKAFPQRALNASPQKGSAAAREWR